MIKNKINLEIYSKDKKVYFGEGESLTISTYKEAEITILPDHISLITFIIESPVFFKYKNLIKKFYITKGTFKFEDNKAIIIANNVKII